MVRLVEQCSVHVQLSTARIDLMSSTKITSCLGITGALNDQPTLLIQAEGAQLSELTGRGGQDGEWPRLERLGVCSRQRTEGRFNQPVPPGRFRFITAAGRLITKQCFRGEKYIKFQCR